MVLWKLKNIPEYTGGTLMPELYDCGCMLEDDFFYPSKKNSYMHTVTDTSKDEFLDYCKKLLTAGFNNLYSNEDEAGIYRQFFYDKALYYCYYIFAEKTARIIKDVCCDSVCDIEDSVKNDVNGNCALMQFGLYYGKMIPGVTCDCGMLYVIRLRDNRLIIIDGGEQEQATQPSTVELMARLRSLTQTSANEPITVAAWFCTHAHDDHFDFFGKLLKDYSSVFKVQRLMFNFISCANNYPPEYIRRIRSRLNEFCPNAKLIKLHTGQCFGIGGASFSVLTTHEDIFPFLPEDERKMNTSCTVIKISFENISFIVLGDVEEENGDIMIKRYHPQTLSSTFLQAAHHGINRDENIYSVFKASTVLLPEGRDIVNKNNFALLQSIYGEKNIVFAGDGSTVFYIKDDIITSKSFGVVGCAYDGSEV